MLTRKIQKKLHAESKGCFCFCEGLLESPAEAKEESAASSTKACSIADARAHHQQQQQQHHHSLRTWLSDFSSTCILNRAFIEFCYIPKAAKHSKNKKDACINCNSSRSIVRCRTVIETLQNLSFIITKVPINQITWYIRS